MRDRLLARSDDLLPSMRLSKPIVPSQRVVPIVPQDSWVQLSDGDVRFIEKTYTFESLMERNLFIVDAIEVETEHKHCSVMTINELSVSVRLFTRNVNVPTDVDKLLATYLDEVYSDVTFSRRFVTGR